MRRLYLLAGLAVAGVVTADPALAQDRSGENAVTQAEDAFGFSVGRESLGIYNAGNARGFSPTAAGNVRIDGLYFDPIAGLSSTLVDSVGIKVGLSAQGYPFAAPSGIVDQTLRRPGAKSGASIVGNFDSFGSFGVEVDGSLVASDTLAFAYGLSGGHIEFPDGTSNWTHGQSLVANWRPLAGVEIVPFWSLFNDYDDEAGTYYVPAGKYLPKLPGQRHYEGPDWSDFRYSATNAGVLASAALSANWRLRLGAFRSVNDQKQAFTNLLLDEQPDGTGERILFADPRSISRSNSGELRLTHSIPDGPRLHVFHLSVRERDARREFGGSDLIDLGPGRIGEKVDVPEQQFNFGEKSHDRLRQTTAGIAYDGRWRDLGEISFGISRARFRKSTFVPGDPVAVSKSNPWLYNGTVAANLAKTMIVYAGYSRGLEESGLAPPNAANRNQPLPVILTEQKDAGIRFNIARGVKAVAGIFDLTRPYFGYDSANVFTHVGTVRSRGAEFSVSGSLTPRVDIVAGGMLLKPRVTRDEGVQGVIGSRPVGFPNHLLNLNLNWRTPMLEGLDLDLAVIHRASSPSTTDNLVFVPARARVDIGSHYHFKLADRSATLRVQLSNVFDNGGFGIAGSGIYLQNAGRFLSGYLTVDL